MAYSITAAAFDPNALLVSSEHLFGEVVTLNAGTYASGQALGRITTGGAYITSLAAAVDGSQAIAAVLPARDAPLVLGAPTSVFVFYTGNFNQHLMAFGAGHTAASVRQACSARGIFIHNPVVGA
jgi:hypothetical protein